MDIFLSLATLFLVGGVLGWVLELVFRRYVSQHKWVNPGFLTGPILPLYGFGVVGFYVFTNYISWQVITSSTAWNYIIEVLATGLLMTAIEYIAGLIFIKGMKVKLWDYSSRPGNIQGIICPLFSVIWTLVGAAYIFWLNPFFLKVTAWVASSLVGISFIDGMLYGVLLVDLGWSIGIVTKIRKAVSDSKLVVSWDNIKASFQENSKKFAKKHSWIFAFKAKTDEFTKLMNSYVTDLKADMAAKNAAQKAKMDARTAKIKAKQKAKKEHHDGD